jgi:Kazal-type serine protease inhibitor domain
MTRLATTPVILGTLVGGMFATGLLAGCSSKQVEIGAQNMDAHALDAPAGSGGAAGAGIDAATAGSGGAAGRVTGAGGVGPGGGIMGSGGVAPNGGTTGVGSGGSAGGSSKVTASGGTSASGGTIASGGTTATGTGCAPDWTLCCGQCLSPFAGVCQTPCPPAGGAGGTGGSTGTGGAGGSTGAKCGGFAGLPCAVGEVCEIPPGTPIDGFGTCVVNPPTADAGADSAGGDGGSTGLPCAGERGDTCPVNQLCDLIAGNCGASDGGGFCVAKPQACSDIYQPVCGCNGATYPSDCVRQLAGVSKDHDGACGAVTSCGGIAGASCAVGQFCEMPAGSCNVADATGTCVVQHTNCLTLSQPECGCDGKTYRNSCYREAAGVSRKSDGACPTADGGADGSRGKTCGGIAGVSCSAGQFCDLQAGSCNVSDATGTCVANAGLGCITIYQPVCGCDGKTYPSDCDRQVAGVSKQADGVCATADAGVCPAGQMWCGPPGCGSGTGYCSTFCSTAPCVAPDAGVGDAASGGCSQVTTQTECDSRSDCHSVFQDPGTCGCAPAGCCAHFNRCADGGRANCNPPVQFGCTIIQPFCEAPYVLSYTNVCYEGCVLQSECAGVDGGAPRD